MRFSRFYVISTETAIFRDPWNRIIYEPGLNVPDGFTLARIPADGLARIPAGETPHREMQLLCISTQAASGKRLVC